MGYGTVEAVGRGGVIPLGGIVVQGPVGSQQRHDAVAARVQRWRADGLSVGVVEDRLADLYGDYDVQVDQRPGGVWLVTVCGGGLA